MERKRAGLGGIGGKKTGRGIGGKETGRACNKAEPKTQREIAELQARPLFTPLFTPRITIVLKDGVVRIQDGKVYAGIAR